MADRALRGMQMGSKSLESEAGVVFADRIQARYLCPEGHEFKVPFAADVAPPPKWECRCGAIGDYLGDDPAEEEKKRVRPVRTHWDMLLERRTLEQLAVVLDEQLEALRSGELVVDQDYRNG